MIGLALIGIGAILAAIGSAIEAHESRAVTVIDVIRKYEP